MHIVAPRSLQLELCPPFVPPHLASARTAPAHDYWITQCTTQTQRLELEVGLAIPLIP